METENEKKPEKKPINLKLIRRFMRGTGKYFIIAAVSTIVAVLSAYLVPIVTSFTVDHVLLPFAEEGYSPAQNSMPAFVMEWVERIGGQSFLIDHLWVMGLALILFTAINALSAFMRRSYIALAGETVAKNMRDDLYGHL
ncbi:MAG: hypothetical protein J6P98_01835, partial [Clostridia bacterium]|nr:hypothetical protein [Clostridia bacterium]